MDVAAIGPGPPAPSRHAGSRTAPPDPQEQAELSQLKATDRKVRAHEQAHSAVGGRYAGAPSYDYQRGPDGILYAVAGEVPIDVGPVSGDPQATIDKMEIVRAAALAPADPSPRDMQIAARAAREKLSAELELNQERGQLVDAEA